MSIIKEMRDVCQTRKLNRRGKMAWIGHWHNVFFTRHISIYFTYLFVKMGISANGVSALMIISGIAGALLCMPHNVWMTVAGAVLLILFEVLDCVDGEVARWTKKSSVRGWYLDLVCHILCNNLVKIICGVHLYLLTSEPVYLVLIFVTYYASASEQGAQRCYYHACHYLPKPPEGAKKPSRSRTALNDFLIRRFWNLVKMPTEIILIKLASPFAVFISYGGNTFLLKVLTWVFTIFSVLWLGITIIHNYFIKLPDVPHVRKTYTELCNVVQSD